MAMKQREKQGHAVRGAFSLRIDPPEGRIGPGKTVLLEAIDRDLADAERQ